MIDSSYLSSKYYDKYGKIFLDLEYLAYKMNKEWDAYIKMYDEMALIALQYGDLNQKYNDDLQAFALMFRNIDINNCNVVDKAYFLSKKHEIIGYRKKIYDINASPKEKLVKCYFEHGHEFELFFQRELGVQIITKNTTHSYSSYRSGIISAEEYQRIKKYGRRDCCFTIEAYQAIKERKYGHHSGIANITDKQCQKLVYSIMAQKTSMLNNIDSLYSTYENYNITDKIGKEPKKTISIRELKSYQNGEVWKWVEYIKSITTEEIDKEAAKKAEEERKRREAEEKRLERYRFNIRNRHWRDGNVSFREADHVYIVDGTPLDSVTTFVKNCFPEFDSEFHAKRKAEALGITKEAVLEMWNKKGRESREQGTTMHKKIESFYHGKEPSTDETFELFKIFADKITLKPYRTEWAVYDWEQKIAGTIDFVDYQNGEYIIYDWKRSDKLIAKNGLPIKNSQYGEKALPPIENLDDSPYYHFALQLSLYKYILEKNYGITVSKLRLGIFHPSYNKPYVLEMPYLQNEIDTLFGLRSEVIF